MRRRNFLKIAAAAVAAVALPTTDYNRGLSEAYAVGAKTVKSDEALLAEWWAQESLAILEENMAMANLVHRDFTESIEAKDRVNCGRVKS